MTYRLKRAENSNSKVTAGVNEESFRKMIAYFKRYLNKELDVQYTTDDDTGATEIFFGVSADTGLEALTSAIIAIKSASQKADVHLYIQKVGIETRNNEESGLKEYHINFKGICH